MNWWQLFLVGAIAGGVAHFTLVVLVPWQYRRILRWWNGY